MAELHRVEINDKAPNEIEPEAEEAVEVQQEEPQVEETQERPEWLPEKFKSAEDMAQAYASLEKRMGQGTEEVEVEQQTNEEEQPQQEDESTEEASNYNEAVVKASQEFFANDGKLSEDTYKKLEGIGLPRDIVDSYAAGQQALLQAEEAQIKGVAGNDYDAMTEWANEQLPQEEIDTFDEAVTSGTVQQAKLAVQGLYARFQNANGAKPQLVQGAVSGSSTMPYQSMQELARAQADPRYKSGDKAYHNEVDRRLSVSKF